MKSSLRPIFIFGYQEALSCLFPVLVFVMLGISHLFASIIPRYDFILIACLVIQVVLFATGVETKDEIKVVCIFHVLGLCMELFKVHVGSWSYPEAAYTKIAGVPLYSGFMYASVASYMCQAWHRLHLQMQHWPPHWLVRIGGALIYVNFFSNHYIPDLRYYIGIYMILLFRKASVQIRVANNTYRLPVPLTFLLIGFFVWMAENIATLLGAWKYANQHTAWTIVSYQKISSWAFLVVVSYIIVAELKMLKDK